MNAPASKQKQDPATSADNAHRHRQGDDLNEEILAPYHAGWVGRDKGHTAVVVRGWFDTVVSAGGPSGAHTTLIETTVTVLIKLF